MISLSRLWVCCAFLLAAVSPERCEAALQNWVLNEKMVNEFQIKALDGDADAGHSLAKHYAYINDFRGAILWGMIAVENGSVDAYYNLGYFLSTSPDPKHQRRAKYLFKRCVELCDKKTSGMAKAFLKDLDNPKRNWPPILEASIFPKW